MGTYVKEKQYKEDWRAFKYYIKEGQYKRDISNYASNYTPYILPGIQFLAVMHVTQEYLFDVSMVVGPSMLPTMNEAGAVLILDKLSVHLGLITRGDVIIAHSPTEPDATVCKRVSALADDIHWCSRHILDIVPPGHVWLLGDNASNSNDSRKYGPVPAAMIIGRVVFSLWPPSQIGRVGREIPDPNASRYSSMDLVII